MITIIVPVFNAEKTIKRCVESIINQQNIQNFELLLINDGSTDKSNEICKEYLTDYRVRLLSKENGGVSSARNYGLTHANGDWILFVDSDDYLSPLTLYKYEKSILDNQTYYVQDYYIDMPNLQWKVEFSQKDNIIFSINKAMEIMMTRYHNSMGYIWHCLFCKKIIDKYTLKFSEELSFGEDAVFAFQYLQYIDKARFIPYKGYHYCNINPLSLTKTIKNTPSQNYLLVSSIFSSMSKNIEKFNNEKSLVIQSYLIRIFLRGVISLNKIDRKDSEYFYLQYRELLSNYTSLYQKLSCSKELNEFVNGYFSELFLKKIELQYKHIKLVRNEYYHRFMDKMYNIFIKKYL